MTIQVKVNFESDNGVECGPLPALSRAQMADFMEQHVTGGLTHGGILFEYDITNGIYTKKVDFIGITNPSENMMLASNGKLYGVTRFGGARKHRCNI